MTGLRRNRPHDIRKMSGADRLKHATFALAGFIPVVGWAGRAAKGGKAIHSTAKGMKAIDNSFKRLSTREITGHIKKNRIRHLWFSVGWLWRIHHWKRYVW